MTEPVTLLRRDSYKEWKKEESFPFRGWDFSHLEGRAEWEDPPWDYLSMARELVRNSKSLLDMGTGGGELLSTLAPIPGRAAATELIPASVELARRRLGPLGVEVIECDHDRGMPFDDGEFDLVLNRHSSLPLKEVSRVLCRGGTFLTQQVDSHDLWDLRKIFGVSCSGSNTLASVRRRLAKHGFEIGKAQDWEGTESFKDVGAIVYFLRVVDCVVPGFSVDRHLACLEELQRRLDRGERLVYSQKRFLVMARKL